MTGYLRWMAASHACTVVTGKAPGLTSKVSASMPVTVQPSAKAARSSSWVTRRGPVFSRLAVAEAHQVAGAARR